MLTDYYKVLQVPRDADAALLRAAYRRLAKTTHPDAQPGLRRASREAQARRFILLAQAYRVLSDPAQRRAHDRALGPVSAGADAGAPGQPGAPAARGPTGQAARGAHTAGVQSENAPGGSPEVSLDDLLWEVDDLLGRFGLDRRSPVERTLEALLDWARRFHAEVLGAWRGTDSSEPDEASGRPGAVPRADREAPPSHRRTADVEAELARIKRELRGMGEPDA